MIHPYSHYPTRAAKHWPEQVALVDGGRQRTYKELFQSSQHTAQALREAGVNAGDRVAVLQQNCIEYVETVIAIAHLGATLVPMLGALTRTDHRYIVNDSGASFVISLTPDTVNRVSSIAEDKIQVLTYGEAEGAINLLTVTATAKSNKDNIEDNIEEKKDPIHVDLPPSSLAQILYTSGTTGRPKGVTHSYASVAAAMGFWATTFNLTPDDRLLGQLPLSHFGGRAMDSCWVGGARLIILQEADPASILATVAEHRVSMILVVPTLLRMILDHPDADDTDLASLRAVLYAASPAAPSLVARALERLGPVLYTGFGQTEAYGLNTIMGPVEHQAALEAGGDRLTSIGKECVAAQVRVRSEAGDDVGEGEVGEIWVWAPWNTPGFWRRPEIDAQRLQDGWLKTGDLGRYDSEGYFFLADRREDMMITGGYNVYPVEVENVLLEHQAVAECGVFSVPDSKWGEAVQAAVVLRAGQNLTEEELITFSKQHLAKFKVPKVIEFKNELPKTPVGKILRRVLREPYWEGQKRGVHGAE